MTGPLFTRVLKAFTRQPERLGGMTPDTAPKALELLGVRGLAEARDRAEQVLRSARRCACCTSLLEHVFARIGSTLFLDDDPMALARAFEERDPFSARVLAAYIVLFGRERITATA